MTPAFFINSASHSTGRQIQSFATSSGMTGKEIKAALMASYKSSNPLQAIPKDQRPAFYASLSDEGKKVVDQGLEWYATVYSGERLK